MTAKKSKKVARKATSKKTSAKARVDSASQSSRDAAAGSAPAGNLLQKLQNQFWEFAESSQEKIPILGMLRPLLGENWLSNMYLNPLDPRRLQAMADAGSFLQEARELTGLTLQEVAQSVGLSEERLQEVESGRASVSMETIFRFASLVARYDPVPFILKFLRTYNPTVEAVMERWGIAAIPKQLERERRFVNIYREHDQLRELSDDEFERMVDYLGSATDLVLDVMSKEKSAARPASKPKKKQK